MDLIDRQKIIEMLEGMKVKDPFDRYEKQNIGLDWAIDAIKAAPAIQTCDDAVSRAQAIDAAGYYSLHSGDKLLFADKPLKDLPAVQPEIIRCKDCKHWRDSDGVYRRGVNAESKCPLNTKEVYAGTFYCGYAERRTDE